MKLNAKKCKEPRLCFVKRPSATPFTNWSTSTQNSSFAQGSRQEGGRCLPGNRCSGPCGYLRRSFTFRPRVQCCVAWYNALPAHLLSTIERVQMRALRIIYLRKLYNLLESLENRRSGLCMSTISKGRTLSTCDGVEGRSPCRESNDSFPIQIPRCDTHFVQFKEEKLIN